MGVEVAVAVEERPRFRDDRREYAQYGKNVAGDFRAGRPVDGIRFSAIAAM